MADIALLHRTALRGARSGPFGATPADGLGSGGPGIAITALPEGTLLQVLASASGDCTSFLATLQADGLAVREAGPGQWFAVSDAPMPSPRLAALRDAIAGQGSILDQSHGRVRIAVDGAPAAALLAKGTAVDLAALAEGRAATTLVGHITVHLTRTGPERFELLVLRGFAGSLWEELIEMGREFGVIASVPQG